MKTIYYLVVSNLEIETEYLLFLAPYYEENINNDNKNST